MVVGIHKINSLIFCKGVFMANSVDHRFLLARPGEL